MPRVVRVQLLKVGGGALVELADGEAIIGTAIGGDGGYVFIAKDVTDPVAQTARSLTDWTAQREHIARGGASVVPISTGGDGGR